MKRIKNGFIISLFAASFCFSQAKFTDFTSAAGIDHYHTGFHYGGGAASGDFNNDGYLDLFVVDGKDKPNLLYLNKGDATFDERAAWAGIAANSLEGMGAVCGDIDNDGDLDLYVTNYFDANRLYLNNGNSVFTDVTETAGVGDPGPSTSAALVDYNNDGLLDIYVLNRSAATTEEIPYANTFYRNNGDGTFTDVAEETGTTFADGISLGLGFFDYDNDGDLDLYIVDEFRRDGFFRNNGDGTFTDIAAEIKLRRSDGMGVDFADYDNDGDLDLYIGDYFLDPLFRNNGDGTFTDVATEVGISNEGVGWGVNFFDYDNDGDKDLYVVNGAMIGQRHDDANVFYKNNGDGTFSLQPISFGVTDAGDGRGSVCGDFNNDGFVDIFLINVLRGKSKLYLNNGGSYNWIKLSLVGTISNRSAIGARVEVVSGGLRQIDEVRAGSSYASMHPLDLEFGLKRQTNIDYILIKWPSGIEQKIRDVGVNQALTITEPLQTTSVDDDQLIPDKFSLFQNFPNPFNPETIISYALNQTGNVELQIINVVGQKIRNFELGNKESGRHEVTWDGKDNRGAQISTGVYLYRVVFHSNDGEVFTDTKKMLFIK